MFESAKHKIERANHHISDVEQQFRAFVDEKPHRFVVETNLTTGVIGIKILFNKNLPYSLALIIGDAIHNLRCALDHATWEVVGIDGGTQNRHLKFPTGDNRTNFEASCQGIITPSQWVKDAIKTTEAFPGGKGADLVELNNLNNSDKHTVITPVLRGTTHPGFTIRTPQGGLIRMENNLFIGGADFVNIGQFPPGTTVELHNNAQCAPGIFLQKANGRLHPINAMLWGLRESVSAAVAAIEAAVPR